MRISTVNRPYVMTFLATGTSSFLMTSDDAQRMLDGTPAVRATAQRVVLQGRIELRPATAGGGPAFVIW